MIGLIDALVERNADGSRPFLVSGSGNLCLADVLADRSVDLSAVRTGDVVALVGDFNAASIAALLRLFEMGCIVMPLAESTRPDHAYFLQSAFATVAIDRDGNVRRLNPAGSHAFLDTLRARRHAGLVLFSTGTTGRPKAILHDFQQFLARYRTPRPALRTLNFLLFDHIGGINTLFHTLFNNGVVVSPSERTPERVLADVAAHDVELLPTTPTFLRMLLLTGAADTIPVPSLKIVTYGTERMDQATLDQLCRLWPQVDFRQTYGMSELGILRIKSEARDSLWMKVGGEGVATKVVDRVLCIRSESRMLGYLNAPSPFDAEGWYETGDLVESNGESVRIVGRTKQVINVGGLKILPGEIERIALTFPGVLRAKAYGAENPITGQHIEVVCEPGPGAALDRHDLRAHFMRHLAAQLRPHRIRIGAVAINHRFKQEG